MIPSDHPEALAEYSTYCTNGFAVIDSQEHRALAAIAAPGRGTTVVADMSSLITLHRLGLLSMVCEYFGKILLPQSYRAAWIEERTRIPHHQPRQIALREAIVRAVHTGKITVCADCDDTIPILDEYADAPLEGTNVVRILQVARWLEGRGALAEAKRATVESNHNPASFISDTEVDAALCGGVVVCRPLTLQTVLEYGWLEELCGALTVSIEEGAYKQLESELDAQKACDEAGVWYRGLIEELNACSRVEFVPVDGENTGDNGQSGNDEGSSGEGHEASEESISIHYGIDAIMLARQQNIPLLADDRFCQQGVQVGSEPNAAFGTDALLTRLTEDEVITCAERMEHILQLIRWRYKFVIPTVSTLLEMATAFRQSPPGAHLREIANYVQHCMRDFGLYGGIEAVEPRTSMARQVFHAWLENTAKFVVELWWDDRFSGEQAARLTRWAVRYLIPAWPRNLPVPTWQGAAALRRSECVINILLNVIWKEDIQRARCVINRVRRSMALTDEEMTSVLESIGSPMVSTHTEVDGRLAQALFGRLVEIVYGVRSGCHWRLLPVARQLGLINPDAIAARVPEEDVAIIRNREHDRRLDPKVGPFVYWRNESGASASFLPDALCAIDMGVRSAALDNLLQDTYCPMAESTRASLERESEGIRAADVTIWVPAVGRVLTDLEGDFLVNIAGFAQAQERDHREGYGICWRNIVRPTADALLAIDCDSWQLLPLPQRRDETPFADHFRGAALDVVLSEYDRIAGHLTLAPPCDLGSVLLEVAGEGERENEAWAILQGWLSDKRRPWRQYHACQALLSNIGIVPEEEDERLWDTVVAVLGLPRESREEGDEVQVWKLESELASHYLRTIDLSGYRLEVNRPVTAAWWAARAVLEVLTERVPSEELPRQIREWRESGVLRDTKLIQYAWTWLCPRVCTPSRSATLYGVIPRSVLLLHAVGGYIKSEGWARLPASIRPRLLECMSIALLTSEAGEVIEAVDAQRLWMWDEPLIIAAKEMASAEPRSRDSDGLEQTISTIMEFGEPDKMKAALEYLPKEDEIRAVFICGRFRFYCYRHPDMADDLRPLLRNNEWCAACAKSVPTMGWDLLLQGLLAAHGGLGVEWGLEVTYALQRLIEFAGDDEEKVSLFVAGLVMASVTWNTYGALTGLSRRRQSQTVAGVVSSLKSSLDSLMKAAEPSIGLRLQSVATLLDQFRS